METLFMYAGETVMFSEKVKEMFQNKNKYTPYNFFLFRNYS